MNDQELTELLDRERTQGFAHLVAAYRERIYWHIRRLVVLHEDALRMPARRPSFVFTEV